METTKPLLEGRLRTAFAVAIGLACAAAEAPTLLAPPQVGPDLPLPESLLAHGPPAGRVIAHAWIVLTLLVTAVASGAILAHAARAGRLVALFVAAGFAFCQPALAFGWSWFETFSIAFATDPKTWAGVLTQPGATLVWLIMYSLLAGFAGAVQGVMVSAQGWVPAVLLTGAVVLGWRRR